MRCLFYGTLRDPDVLASVLGRFPAASDISPVRVTGHRAAPLRDAPWPILLSEPGALADGIVVDNLNSEDEARLRFYEGPPYDLVDLKLGDGIVQVFVHRTPGPTIPGVWSLERWQAEHKPKALPVLRAYMREYAAPKPTLGHEHVALLARDTAFQAYFRIDRYRVRHPLIGGGQSGEIVRELFERGRAAAVLPYDPERDEVVLIRQFRVGPYANGEAPWAIEIVAGIIDAGEAAVDVARRELKEEANLEPTGSILRIGLCYVSPGGSTETCENFIAPVDAAKAGGVFGLAEEGEDIQVLVWPYERAFRALSDGLITAAPAVIALQWLALNRERLRREWR